MTRPASIDRLLARVASESEDLPPLQLPQEKPKLFDEQVTSDIDAYATRPCVRAALHLLNDDVERAHKIAQDDEGDMTSNLCHAILHRREGDFWNSKWWYRQIQHPLIQQVYGSTTQAQSFVDAVEQLVGGKRGSATACAAGSLAQLKRRQADELSQLVTYALQQEQS